MHSNSTLIGAQPSAKPATSRSRQVIIALLSAVLLVQLYILHVWMADPHAAHTRSKELNLAKQQTKSCTSFDAENTPLTAERARSALHVIKQYIQISQQQQNQQAQQIAALNAAFIANPSLPSFPQLPGLPVIDTTPAAAAAAAAPGGPSKEIVGKSLVKAGHRLHGNHGAHGHSNREEAIHSHEVGEAAHSQEFLKIHKNLYSQLRLNFSLSWANDELDPEDHHSISPENRIRKKTCLEYFYKYGVEIESSWGTMPEGALREDYRKLKCDEVISLHQVARFIRNETALYDRVWDVDPNRYIPVPTAPNTYKDTIAIIVAMTTRGLTIRDVTKDLVLFKDLFPSLLASVEPGFEYWFYLGYDKGDQTLDNPANLAIIQKWFDENMSAVALKRGIVMKIIFSSWVNKWKKPGPAFNYVCGVAYADGAEFIYRINDDQIFETPWAKKMTQAVLGMGKPYGIVGPTCKQGATQILIVDFVHRTHHEIFPTHYPPSLMAWWMDNWATQVYGRERTIRLPDVTIAHLLDSHGTRYTGMFQIGQFLIGEKVRSRALIEMYMAHTPGMEAQLAKYKQEDFDYKM